MRAIIPLALAAVLSGCGSTEKEMLESVRAEFRDPASVQFTQLQMNETLDGSINILCGMANAKNGFGGYAGPRPFTASKSKNEKEVVVDISESASCAAAQVYAQAAVLERTKR